jgi:hypothetical protein
MEFTKDIGAIRMSVKLKPLLRKFAFQQLRAECCHHPGKEITS